jgi:23S rRNA A1618 N6-methylase RlmF
MEVDINKIIRESKKDSFQIMNRWLVSLLAKHDRDPSIKRVLKELENRVSGRLENLDKN